MNLYLVESTEDAIENGHTEIMPEVDRNWFKSGLVTKVIFGTEISGENWTRTSARFQFWAEQFGLDPAESLAYILAGQGRLGEYHTTQEEFESAQKKLEGKMPTHLSF